VRVLIIVALLGIPIAAQSPALLATEQSRLNLPLTQRLDTPLRIAGARLTLADFTGFVATSFKVPLLVETTNVNPELRIPAGSFTARKLLDIGLTQLRGYTWKDESGVAHVYERRLVASRGNLLNVNIHRFWFQNNVAEFLYTLKSCIHSTIEGYGCEGGVISDLPLPELQREPLPYLEPFKDVPARSILMRALQANGHFYVLIASENTHPRLNSTRRFIQWFSYSLVPDQPQPMWIQRKQLP
jgi:hypothetical protein